MTYLLRSRLFNIVETALPLKVSFHGGIGKTVEKRVVKVISGKGCCLAEESMTLPPPPAAVSGKPSRTEVEGGVDRIREDET